MLHNTMNAENNVWSSGESEPEENVSDRDIVSDVDLGNTTNDDNDETPDVYFSPYFYPSIKDFAGKSTVRSNVSINKITPLECFKHFLDPALVNLLLEQTNLYQEHNPESARKNMKVWTDLTEAELWTFIALSINMGHVVKGQLNDYWSQDPLLCTPIFGDILSRNRYLQILRYLHFSNNLEVSNHPLKKLKPVIDHLKTKFSNTTIAGKILYTRKLSLVERKTKI